MMFSLKSRFKLKILIVTILSIPLLLKASYYQDTLFPIGLTGINPADGNPPYSEIDPDWTWAREQELIDSLGINCIGCQDANPTYLVDLKPTGSRSVKTYIDSVSALLWNTKKVYIITAGYYVDNPGVSMCALDTIGDSIFDAVPCGSISYDWVDYPYNYGNHSASRMFRSPYRGNPSGSSNPGVGDMQLSMNGSYDCHGDTTDDALWDTYDGDTIWQEEIDEAVTNFEMFFDSNSTYASYIWGFNLITEDPAMYRGTSRNPPWHGCWAAVDRVLNGSNTAFDVNESTRAEHEGFRGITFQDSKDRMVVAKGHVWMYASPHPQVNIFEYLPDIDVIVEYNHFWNRAIDDYGDQHFLDRLLYGSSHADSMTGWEHPEGYHHTAVYMQRYGDTPGGPSGQERRWMPGLCIESRIDSTVDTFALCRRPCPPEIRAATYLCLSRGAKGILYHPWLIDYTSSTTGDNYKPPSNLHIPSDTLSSTRGYYNVGLRDCYGYPFGDDNSDTSNTHKLNNGNGDTYWHDHNDDTTYAYLKTLIQEIKKLAPILMQLDWVNGYSLKSTVSGKSSPCPHMYVKSVTTNRSGYIDLGFFDDPDDASNEYFMVVNRDGIAEMDTAKIVITFDGSCWGDDHLVLTDMADTTHPDTLDRSGMVFVSDTILFAPGEGKLYRVKGTVGGSVHGDLFLWGRWCESSNASGYMNTLTANSSLGWAHLFWRWMKDLPATLEKMKSWGHTRTESEWQFVPPSYLGADLPADKGFFWGGMRDSLMYFIEMGEHIDGKDTLETAQGDKVGTASNEVTIHYPGSSSGCPDLYSFFYLDTAVQPGHEFIENNTILPHSQHVVAIADDKLKLDCLNDDPDYYYLSIVENNNSTTYLDQVRMWVVDHDEGDEVAVSADDSIYVYSDMASPTSCKDNFDNDKLDEVLWEDTLSFGGPQNAYLTVKFDDPGWTNVGLLVSMGSYRETAPPPKDYLSIPQEPGRDTWDSLGVAYGRKNPSQWVVDVSECDSFTFRLLCRGSDSCFIDRLALGKLESSGWQLTEADLDSAVHYNSLGEGTNIKGKVITGDTLADTLLPSHQISLRFDKIDTSTTYPVRDFVFESRGVYITPPPPHMGIQDSPLQFWLEVEQMKPLSRVALINYSVPYDINVKIGVYDVSGRLVKSIVNEKVKAGKYSEEWKGKDEASRTLASGVYFVKMMTDDFEKTTKIVILE